MSIRGKQGGYGAAPANRPKVAPHLVGFVGQKHELFPVESSPHKRCRQNVSKAYAAPSSLSPTSGPQLDKQLRHLRKHITQEEKDRRAVKADDAEVPLANWTNQYVKKSTIKWTSLEGFKVQKSHLQRLLQSLL